MQDETKSFFFLFQTANFIKNTKDNQMVSKLAIALPVLMLEFTKADILKVDEKKNKLILADAVQKVYKDTISDGDANTDNDEVIENSFPSLRSIELPLDSTFEDSLGNVSTVYDYLKSGTFDKQIIGVKASVTSQTNSKIVLESARLTEYK